MKSSLKIVVSGTILMLLAGCSTVLEQQTAKMDDYRSVVDQEQLMTKEVREKLYQDQLWYNPDLWQSHKSSQKSSQKTTIAKQRTQDFFGCVQTAEEIEKNISVQIGGRDPIQTIHARATIEICMISKQYQAIDRSRKLICESEGSDVLPICDFSHDVVLDYRSWG